MRTASAFVLFRCLCRPQQFLRRQAEKPCQRQQVGGAGVGFSALPLGDRLPADPQYIGKVPVAPATMAQPGVAGKVLSAKGAGVQVERGQLIFSVCSPSRTLTVRVPPSPARMTAWERPCQVVNRPER